LSNADESKTRVAVIAATAFIVVAFSVSYFLWGHDGLPIGSDSPGYVAQSQLVAVNGPLALLAQQGPYNFLYQLISGFIVWAGAPALDVEIVLPVILIASLPYLLSRLVLKQLDARAATLVVLSTPAWYAVYRITADLHANLFALTLVVGALIPLSQARILRSRETVMGLGLVGLASLAHIESTLFLTSIIVLAGLVSWGRYPFRVMVALAMIIVPATVLYVVHLEGILALTGGTLELTTPMTLEAWLLFLGPLLPFTAFGLVTSFRNRIGWLEALAFSWGLASIVVGLSQYVTPQTVLFARRSVILLPTPILAGLGAFSLLQLLGGLKLTLPVCKKFRFPMVGLMVVFLVVSWPTVYALGGQQNHRVFLSSPEYQQLVWVHSNLRSTSTPIFMFNDVDQYAGSLASLYDNWLSVVVGDHLSYLGLVDYLVQLEETPFSEPVARATSTSFMQQIRDSGITSRTGLLQHQIILLSDFYRPFPLPTYMSNLFVQVSPGIFVDDPIALASISRVTLPLYTSFIDHSGSWGGVNENWTRSGEAYEVYYDGPAPMNIDVSFFLGVATSGNYSVGLRYWDQTGNNLTITLDSKIVGSIYYDNAKTPILREFRQNFLTAGIHTFTITIEQSPYPLQWASLDYLVFEKG
jgi:hypothetical protein